MKKSAIFAFILINFLFLACRQTKNNSNNEAYQIDIKIKEQIKQKVKTSGIVTMGSMDFKMYQNDSLIVDTYSKDKSIDCRLITTLNGDTASITGFMGMFSGFGYQIGLFKDTCIVRHFAKSDTEIYKLSKTDSLTFGVSVPCKSYKLTLVETPILKKGEIISGIIELESEDYFEVANGDENRYRIELKGYFKTEPLQTLDEKLKQYEKR
jgi:hypothetical protein